MHCPVKMRAGLSVQLRRAPQLVATRRAAPTRLSSRIVAVKAVDVQVPLAELEDLCFKALKSLEYTDDEANILREVMMYAQVRGNNQGLIKITSGGMARAPNAGTMELEKDTRLSALLNGRNEAGMLVLHRAMTLAAEKARAHGVGIVGTNHTSTSTGALAYYAETLGNAGLIGVVLAQSPEFVAPHGAKQAIFGTNPICISVPSARGAVTMDMATAAYAWFGLHEAKTAGRPIPGHVGMTKDGKPTTDPAAVLAGGALRTFDGGYKSSNLALMVELLAGPFVGAAVADKLEEKNWGNLVVAIDPALLQDLASFRARVQAVLDRVKNARRLEGVDEIVLPGERSAAAAAAVAASGIISVEANLLSALRGMAAQHSGNGAGRGGAAGWSVATRLVHPTKGGIEDPYESMAPPLYQTATFNQPSATENGPFDYTRSGNPTRALLEAQMAELEGADRALAFSSGMSALSAVCRLVKHGEHIIAGEDIYGGTSRLLSRVVPEAGVTVTNVDHTDLAAYERAFIPGRTKLVMLESPTNPRMQVCDLRKLAAIAKRHGALVMVDNSIMTPVYQLPLDLGADISMISATKFVGGHSDVTGGILSVRGKELGDRLYFYQNAEGTGLPPFECWLALRGLKTMALRMEKQVANALAIAQFLDRHPLITRVNYAGLPGSAASALNSQQATSGGSLLSFTTGNIDLSKYIVEKTKLFSITVSFGSTSSLISLPCYMSHASIPKEVREARGLPDDLVRISAGIEDAVDLLADLEIVLDGAIIDLQLAPKPRTTTPSESSMAHATRELLQRFRIGDN